MSKKQASWIPLSKGEGVFSGGVVTNVSSLYLANKFSPYARNIRLDGQSVTIRPGHDLFATLTAGDYPRGIGTYYRTVATNDRLIVRHNTDATHKLYTIDTDGTATSITTSSDIASDNRMTFLNVGDDIYCMNGSDDLGKLSGTTYTTPSTGIANFAPSFGVDFSSSHWASGWSSNPNKVYKSVGNDYEDFNSAGSDSFDFNEQIKGLAENDKTLLVFTQNTISSIDLGDFDETNGRLTYNTSSIQVQEGTLVHSSIVTVGMNTYFLSSSNKILRLRRGVNVDGFEIEQLSNRKYAGIDEIIATLDTDQSDSFAYFCQDKNIIKWFVKTIDATFNDLCIIYDITKDAFLIDSNKFFYGGVFFKGNNYTISQLEPKVYKDEYSQTDEQTAISFEYHTKDFYITDPTYKKVLWETRTLTFINELAELTQEIYANGGLIDTKTIDKGNIITGGGIGTSEIGTYEIGVGNSEEDEEDELQEVDILRTAGNLNVIGKKFKFVFKCSTVAAKLRLEDINVLVEGKPAITTNLTT